MPSPTTIALFALATLILTATPGPGVLYVTARTMAQGRRAGLASMFGIEAGEVVWLVAVATGVAAVLSASAASLQVLRFGGAVYLIFLGIQRWRSTKRIEQPRPVPLARVFAQGVVTQLLNPKVAVFFLAFLPQFVDTSRPVLPQVVALGGVYIGVAVAVDMTYVLAANAVFRRFVRGRRGERRADRVAAATYIALGVAAAASGVRRP